MSCLTEGLKKRVSFRPSPLPGGREHIVRIPEEDVYTQGTLGHEHTPVSPKDFEVSSISLRIVRTLVCDSYVSLLTSILHFSRLPHTVP